MREDIERNVEEQIINAWSQVLNKVEELWDMPVYTELDLIKQLRIDYLLVDKKIEQMRDQYAVQEDVIEPQHPYED